MGIESNYSRLHRLKKIEDKFQYVNLICPGINQLIEHQTDCVKNLDWKYETLLQNAIKGKRELARFSESKQKAGDKTCSLTVVFLLVDLFIGYILHSQFCWAILLSRLHFD